MLEQAPNYPHVEGLRSAVMKVPRRTSVIQVRCNGQGMGGHDHCIKVHQRGLDRCSIKARNQGERGSIEAASATKE